MFYSLTGNIDLIEENFIVLNCGGVGFKINTTLTTQIATQNEKTVTLYTHLNVKEDALDIYGFSNKQELSCFKMLISVSGIGPKAALSILCEMTPQGFAQAVAMGDYKALTKAQGVGAKTAQRVVLELKDKIEKLSFSRDVENIKGNNVPSFITSSAQIDEATQALCVLGYSKQEAQRAAEKVTENGEEDVEEIIKKSLSILAKF